mmetsp:Transcript_222/g.710  ORF Transcript_222/g.710 Transcript_222/m.710 type:complete len:203 (+) Transcript_222:492-1100(+)
MHPGYMLENVTPVSSCHRSLISLMVMMLHSFASLYALGPMNRSPSIMAFSLRSPSRPARRPDMSPRLARGGTCPARVLVFAVTEPTTHKRLSMPMSSAFTRSCSRRFARRKCPRCVTPTDSSNPSTVYVGSTALGKYTAALQMRAWKVLARLVVPRNFLTKFRTDFKSPSSSSITEYDPVGKPSSFAAFSAFATLRTAITTW